MKTEDYNSRIGIQTSPCPVHQSILALLCADFDDLHFPLLNSNISKHSQGTEKIISLSSNHKICMVLITKMNILMKLENGSSMLSIMASYTSLTFMVWNMLKKNRPWVFWTVNICIWCKLFMFSVTQTLLCNWIAVKEECDY